MNQPKPEDQPRYPFQSAPDIDFWPVTHQVLSVEIRAKTIAVLWDDNQKSCFHPLWLREQCPCPDCHHPVTRESIMDLLRLPEDLYAQDVSLDDAGYLIVTWSNDAHTSRYHPGWLRANSYDDWARKPTQRNRITWGEALDLTVFDGKKTLEDDGELYDWLSYLELHGLALVSNVPTSKGTVQELAERIGVIRSSNFGAVFDVMSKPEADSNAYLTIGLPLHMDLPTRECPPGLQFLHCLKNEAEGGESQFVDTFEVARALKVEAPEIYKIITTVDFPFRNRAVDSDYRWQGPLIQLDAAGNPVETRINTFLPTPILNMNNKELESVLKAKYHLFKMVNESRFLIQFKMQSGDMVVFDNRRVLHARSEFFPQTGERHLQGCYMDRDELYSCLRVLERHQRERGMAPAI
ncbi:MAG: gamma-butyrobetaine dioxygenase [Sneathiella sp.]|nr:MAG: gamma-butyrobetaine dioxygenase [Sneathiella sp.]